MYVWRLCPTHAAKLALETHATNLLLPAPLAAPQALESSCHEAFDVERQGQVLTITPALPSGGSVADVWAAMQHAGMLDKHLQFVAGEWRCW